MNTMQKSKLQISLINLDDITHNTLKFFFNSNLCDKAELKRKDKEINVYIIDSDRKFNRQIISSLKKNNQFVIFLYNEMNNPISEENTYTVTKPVQVKYLKQQIDFITVRINETHETHETHETNETNETHETHETHDTHDTHETHETHETNETETTETISISAKRHDKQLIQNTKQQKLKSKLFQISCKQKSTTKPQNNHLSNALKNTTELNTNYQYKAHKYVGSNKDIDPDNPEEIRIIYHNPRKYLYYYLAKAIKTGKTNKTDILIKTLLGNLLYDFKSQTILHQFSKSKMRYFKSSPLFLEAEVMLTSISAQAKEINTISQNAENLTWQAAISASKGRVPLGTSLTQTVEMRNWPNFSQLLVFRHVIQISAAWSTHHMSLLDTATQLHIPQRYIFTLYNAMLAINSAKINNVINNVRKINSDKRKSVFSKILSRIFNH